MIRHGIAAERGTYANDDERPLTEEGQKRSRQVAQRLRELKLNFDLILTSPLVRASQTAAILQAVGLGDRIEVSDTLAPEGSLQDWLAWFESWQQDGGDRLALVGHEPDLSRWAETLIWGEAREILTLKKAGVIGLALPSTGSPVGHSSLFWLTAPRLLL